MPTIVPIVDAGRGWRSWHLSEIYTGPTGTGRYVPNIEDAVWDWNTGIYRVIMVYPPGHATLANLSELDRVNIANLGGGVLSEDVLLGTGPNSVSESYRVYIDTSVTPHTMAFDARLHVYGSAAHHVKLFRGSDISIATGHIISGVFNLSGTLLTEDIPLEPVVHAGTPSIAIKTPVLAGCIETVANGEVVTCVVYSATNEVLSISKMIAVVTNFIHRVDTNKRYVLGIQLLSPYLSSGNAHLLEYPVNMLVQSGSLQGRVTYSDATTADFPIDDIHFSVLGMDNFVATTAGQTVPIVLKYILQPNEYGYDISAPLPDRFITEPYTLTTIESQGSYSVKLFVVPYWAVAVGATPAQWKLRYYLYTMDRDSVVDVTSHVQASGLTAGFNGQVMNVTQSLTVAVNLHEVDPLYLYYRHVQSFTIKLENGATNALADSYWIIQYQGAAYYGAGNFATAMPDPANPSLMRVNISMGLTNVDDFLNEYYWPTDPLRYAPGEIAAPVPTHVRVRVGDTWVRELELYEALMNIDGVTTPVVQSTLVRLEFYRHTFAGDLELATASTIVQL